MRNVRRVVLAVVAAMLASVAMAQSVAVRELWPLATAAAEGGDYAAADARLSDLIAAGRSNGIAGFPAYAESAVALARHAQGDQNPELAGWALKAAAQLDPTSPEVAFGSASVARMRGDWAGVVSASIRGFGNVASHYLSRTRAQMDLIIVLAISIIAVTFVLAFVLFIRHRRRAVHDFTESLLTKMGAPAAMAVAWALLFLPFFLTLAFIWLFLWWFVLFFGYASKRERVATIVMLVLFASTPLLLEWAAWKTAALTSPIIRAASAGLESSYRPGTVRRLREMSDVSGSNGRMLTLLGTLEAQEGNEPQAMALLKRAIENEPNLAGAHLNLGNLHFLNNDFIAAMTEYDKAAAIDSGLAIAYYNHSVAAGELYRFDLQGQKLEQAKAADRREVESLLKSPPAQKIVGWNLPMGAAWTLHSQLAAIPAAREYFGNYTRFVPAVAALNPVTIGALAAIILAPLSLLLARRRGFAGDCVKCGRTFCAKCKSSRESATYCTQCIHIYLKRDGVSLETKKKKLEEVQVWQQRTVRVRRMLSILAPGAGRVYEGFTTTGLIGISLFALAVVTAVLAGRLAPIASPAGPLPAIIRVGAIIVAIVVWLAYVIPAWRARHAQG